MSAFIVLILRILLVVLLYLFIGWAIYTIYRDLRVAVEKTATRRIPPIILTQENELVGETFDRAEIIIGRDPNCELPLADEMISSRHARLSYHHNQWWVEDSQSTNGTYLNEERVFIATVLVEGDELRFGNTHISVSFHTRQGNESESGRGGKGG